MYVYVCIMCTNNYSSTFYLRSNGKVTLYIFQAANTVVCPPQCQINEGDIFRRFK